VHHSACRLYRFTVIWTSGCGVRSFDIVFCHPTGLLEGVRAKTDSLGMMKIRRNLGLLVIIQRFEDQ
jgi:hypothetical protein